MERRSFFNNVLVGFEDAAVTHLGSFLKALAASNKSFVILGDSLSYQTLSSIQCELYREKVEFDKSGKGIYNALLFTT